MKQTVLLLLQMMEYMSKILDVVMVQLQNLWIWLTTQTLAERLDPIASACISRKLWSIW